MNALAVAVTGAGNFAPSEVMKTTEGHASGTGRSISAYLGKVGLPMVPVGQPMVADTGLENSSFIGQSR